MQHAADPDSLVHEWAEAVIGDQYPVPDRILHFTEILVQDYLSQEMCDNRPPRGTFDLFLPPKAEPPPCVTSSIPSRRTSCWIKVTVSPPDGARFHPPTLKFRN